MLKEALIFLIAFGGVFGITLYLIKLACKDDNWEE